MSDVQHELHDVIQSIRAKSLLAKRVKLTRGLINEEIFKPLTSRMDALRERPNEDELPVTVKTEIVDDDNESIGTAKKRKRDDFNADLHEDSISKELPIQKKKVRRRALAHDALVRRYLTSFTTRNNDTIYGVYKHNNKWYLGGKKIKFLPDNIIQVDDYTTQGTPGLYELLFRKDPKHIYTDKDLQEYKTLLQITHAHYLRNDPTTGAYKDEDHEKIDILTNLFDELTVKGGEGLKKIEDNKDFDYVFWNDPNELVERLKLLIASQKAGNYSHTNEIVSIIEELKEGGYIQ